MSEDNTEEVLVEDAQQESVIDIQIYKRSIGNSQTERNGRNPSTGDTMRVQTNVTKDSALGAYIKINL